MFTNHQIVTEEIDGTSGSKIDKLQSDGKQHPAMTQRDNVNHKSIFKANRLHRAMLQRKIEKVSVPFVTMTQRQSLVSFEE